MKKLAIFLSAALVSFLLCVVLFTISPLRLLDGDGKWFYPPCDISYGLAEVECLRQGIDPYDIWSGKTILKGYRPGLMSPPTEHVFSPSDAPVNVHPPWFYTAILPFSFLPHRIAAAVHFSIMVLCLALLWILSYKMVKKAGGSSEHRIIIPTFAILVISLPAFQDFHSQNWAIMTLAAAVLMAYNLNHKHNVLAGICWSFIMIKPQVGLIFAIPLILEKKIVTFVVAVICCLISSTVPAILCKSSILDMIIVTPSSNYTQFWGCGTLPKIISDLLPQSIAIYLGLAIGIIICTILTKMLSMHKDWFIILMPAAVCSSLWTYSRCYGHVTSWFFILILLLEILRRPNSRFLWITLFCSSLLFSRATNFIHIITTAFNWSSIPSFLHSDNLHFHIDSTVSFLSLIVVILFCFHKSKLPKSKESVQS